MDLGSEIEKANVGIRISIVKKTGNFDFFDPNLLKNEFWGRNFKNPSPDSESALPRYQVCQFSVKTDNFDFWAQICQKMDFGVKILKI